MTPQLWVFAGPNDAGKTTLIQRYIAGRIEIVDPDKIARQIDSQNFNDTRVISLANRQAVQRRRTLLLTGQSFGWETTLTGRSGLCGYKVNLIFVGIKDTQQSFSRVGARVELGGHNAPDIAIARRFGKSLENLPEAMRIARRILLIDNTGK